MHSDIFFEFIKVVNKLFEFDLFTSFISLALFVGLIFDEAESMQAIEDWLENSIFLGKLEGLDDSYLYCPVFLISD